MIDIGHMFTNVVIYGLDGLPFVRDINIAGSNIIQEICRQTELSENQIQQAFMRGRSSETHDGNLLLALNNAIGPLVNAINETLRFYSMLKHAQIRFRKKNPVLTASFCAVDFL